MSNELKWIDTHAHYNHKKFPVRERTDILSKLCNNTPTSGAIAVSGGWITPKTKAEAHCDNNVLFSAFF